jgi:hypothetical protein
MNLHNTKNFLYLMLRASSRNCSSRCAGNYKEIDALIDWVKRPQVGASEWFM